MKEKLKKIVVKTEDELIDLVREISSTEKKRILVSFPESSDILISSINLKVLLDSADEKESSLILQILKNPTGVRNSKLAGISVIDTPTPPPEELWEEALTNLNTRLELNKKGLRKLSEKYNAANTTSFEEKVNSVLQKNKIGKSQEKPKSSHRSNDIEIVVDQDINTKTKDVTPPQQEDLTKVDFKNIADPTKKVKNKKFSLKSLLPKKTKAPKPIPPSMTKRKEPKPNALKDKLVRLLPRVVIPLFFVLLLVSFLYYQFAPYVKVTLHIQSKPVEIEKLFTGNENINEIDFEKLEIPIKTESTTKSVSDTVNATGVAYRGEKAEGTVTISYINPDGCTEADEAVSIYVGHQIETGDKKYLLTGDITITCNDYGVIGVEAIEVGEEYNIPSGKYFSIDGFDSAKVYAVNSAAFTGGSKEEYTVLAQNDVTEKVKELTEIATEESLDSLDEIGNGWEIIESTIESEVKEGSIETTIAIGTETDTSDISLEAVSSATYYYTHGVDEGLITLLTEAALNQNLFDSSEGLNLTLTGDVEKELTVEESAESVSIKLVASSSVEPSVDREEIIEDLLGLSWEEGNKYISDLSFTSRDPLVVFTPDSFPQKLRHFPSRQGRVNVEIKQDSVENND
ncbi:hypothetical protein K8R20_00460 [bacterium]|nr:hypothetical protein [bacterium]